MENIHKFNRFKYYSEKAAKQLTHALRALRTGQNQHAAVYVGNVQNLLPGLRMRLGKV